MKPKLLPSTHPTNPIKSKGIPITPALLKRAETLKGQISPQTVSEVLGVSLTTSRRWCAEIAPVVAGRAAKSEVSGAAMREFIEQHATAKGYRITSVTKAAALLLESEKQYSFREIARIVKVSRETVSEWVNKNYVSAQTTQAQEALYDSHTFYTLLLGKSQKSDVTPRVNGPILRRSFRLLNMEYKPSELAGELGVTQTTIYNSYIPSGLPMRKDRTGRVWISGADAKNWIKFIRAEARRIKEAGKKEKLPFDYMYCVRCGKVKPKSPKTKMIHHAGMMYGKCPHCGTELRKFIKRSEVKQ